MERESTPFGIHESMPDILSKDRYEGTAPNNEYVKAAIVIPAEVSQAIYGAVVAEVKCFSRRKPGYHYRALFPLGPLTEVEALEKAGYCAGAMAENLCQVYKDILNSVEWAKDGVSAFGEALKSFHRGLKVPVQPDNTLAKIIAALKEMD